MESKIPLPTDNIYKFYALFSLLLLIFSVGAFVYNVQNSNSQVVEIYPELQELKNAKHLSHKDEARLEVLEAMYVAVKSDRSFYNKCLGALIGLALSGMAFGFIRWHVIVQPLQDEIARVQLELAKLQLEAIQADRDKRNAAVDKA